MGIKNENQAVYGVVLTQVGLPVIFFKPREAVV